MSLLLLEMMKLKTNRTKLSTFYLPTIRIYVLLVFHRIDTLGYIYSLDHFANIALCFVNCVVGKSIILRDDIIRMMLLANTNNRVMCLVSRVESRLKVYKFLSPCSSLIS